MSKTLDFYFEYSSPYGYFASTGIEALAARHDLTIRWHPILLGPMFKAMGSAPLVNIPLKGEYSRRDFQRTAKLFGIPYTHPDPFPIATVSAARATLYAREQHPEKLATLVGKLYAGFFAQGRAINETSVVLDICAESGLNRSAAESALAEDSLKALLKSEVDHALSQGVFGSPFLIIDNEPFWGFDRFDHIEKWLQTTARPST